MSEYDASEHDYVPDEAVVLPEDVSKVLLVGEQNPYGGDEYFALYPSPDGSAGERLCRLILGRTRAEYLAEFDRRNLIRRGGPWRVADARAEAAAILASGRRRIVALGAKVGGAFADAAKVERVHFGHIRVGGTTIAFLPHPSGRCRVWDEPGAIRRARDIIASMPAPERTMFS